jgi:hypothetical protein
MEVLNEYKDSHHYMESYERSPYHCPLCGKQELWEALSGDYYIGPTSYCTSCAGRCNLVNAFRSGDPRELAIVEQLKTGVALEPTTRQGN